MWRCRSAALCLSFLLLTGGSLAQPAASNADDLQDLLLERAGEVQSPLAQQVLSFYLERNFAPAWQDPADIFVVRSVLAHAAEQGLRPIDYAVPGEAGTPAFDLALTAALFRYASDVHTGRVRQTVYKDARLPVQDFEFAPLLSRALARHRLTTLLATLPPSRAQYQQLVGSLAFYRALAAHGGWPAVKNEQQLGYRLMLEDPSLAGQPPGTPIDVQAALMR
jgi:murein L,D-transpeptidase YcbB/YkuD